MATNMDGMSFEITFSFVIQDFLASEKKERVA